MAAAVEAHVAVAEATAAVAATEVAVVEAAVDADPQPGGPLAPITKTITTEVSSIHTSTKHLHTTNLLRDQLGR